MQEAISRLHRAADCLPAGLPQAFHRLRGQGRREFLHRLEEDALLRLGLPVRLDGLQDAYHRHLRRDLPLLQPAAHDFDITFHVLLEGGQPGYVVLDILFRHHRHLPVHLREVDMEPARPGNRHAVCLEGEHVHLVLQQTPVDFVIQFFRGGE